MLFVAGFAAAAVVVAGRVAFSVFTVVPAALAVGVSGILGPVVSAAVGTGGVVRTARVAPGFVSAVLRIAAVGTLGSVVAISGRFPAAAVAATVPVVAAAVAPFAVAPFAVAALRIVPAGIFAAVASFASAAVAGSVAAVIGPAVFTRLLRIRVFRTVFPVTAAVAASVLGAGTFAVAPFAAVRTVLRTLFAASGFGLVLPPTGSVFPTGSVLLVGSAPLPRRWLRRCPFSFSPPFPADASRAGRTPSSGLSSVCWGRAAWPFWLFWPLWLFWLFWPLRFFLPPRLRRLVWSKRVMLSSSAR